MNFFLNKIEFFLYNNRAGRYIVNIYYNVVYVHKTFGFCCKFNHVLLQRWSFYHKEGKKRMEREMGVQNVQTESVFLDYKTKSKKASKL